MSEDFKEEQGGFETPPSFFPYEHSEETSQETSRELVEVGIEGLFAAESNGSIHRFVLLSDGFRKLSIIIGPFEAQAISMPLEGTEPDRPMTHDLIKAIIDKFEGFVEKIVIDDLWSTTYYAKIFINHGENVDPIVLDSRPSDAIAIAVRFGCPIYVVEAILKQHEG
jgi:bifunctional DNase/RNase